ncbi:MAG TPA: tetraacyldisaccharide 4'-kinase [Phnomibacter sp.]|nr:tetraacyldisaccharide 4'-kinase [Phnomibacter sp.]
MSFNFYLFRGLRLLLFPLSMLAGIYITLRNYFYDRGWLRSATFNLPLICVGNLSVGGTGKSPMTEYLLRLLSPRFQVAVLSRGYKRKTTGYLLADASTTALEIGDEPMQFHKKFPVVAIAVGEERLQAIPQLLHDRPGTQVIVLDDAFQHRRIRAGLNILLTAYANPYWQDHYLPTGDLRDNPGSASRAQIIIVTKCPPDLNEHKRDTYIRSIGPLPHQQVYFTTIQYGEPYHLRSKMEFKLHQGLEVLLVCGIADPLPLKKHLEENVGAYFEKNFDDHHIFSIDDWKDIVEKYESMDAPQKIILTTEKDAVRLEKFGELLGEVPLFVLPIRHRFLFGGESGFDRSLTNFVSSFSHSSL